MRKFGVSIIASGLLVSGAALGMLGCGDRDAAESERGAYDKMTEHQQQMMEDPGYRQMVEEEQRRRQEMFE
jgi:hypothetical protein